ncbi:MAG: glycerophosphodiester phosphodiesterase [Rhodospirillum sp.]|nr:glycerophosphodiester phosphodiesterase [Rhodospirillum sp.]MCF8487989.1 glycerophosphodiester phosphodiesterase [Rhodospirillum sp.]MCF8500486.1 glycerophosphodiester phosphodiesterase [Rhodospirillum sp.]
MGSAASTKVAYPPIPHRVMGHRGAAASAPENTLAGARQAFGEGARWIEFDVKLTADGVPVIFHDDRLDRVTSGHGLLADRTLVELRELDAGGWFGPQFQGELIPTLEEMLTLLASLGMGANIEIKPCPGRAVETARRSLDVARVHWPDFAPPLVVSSFDLIALAEARDVAPEWPMALLADGADGWTAETMVTKAGSLGCQGIHLDNALATKTCIAACGAAGFITAVWTVNSAVRADALWEWGVDAIISDRPGALLRDASSQTNFRE